MEKVKIKELISNIEQSLKSYKSNPSITSKAKLNCAQVGNVLTVQQNTMKNSVYSDLAKAGIEVVQLLLVEESYKKPVYLGVKIGNYIYFYFSAIKRVFGVNPQTIYEYTASLKVNYLDSSSNRYDMHTYELNKKPIMLIIQDKIQHSSTILIELTVFLDMIGGVKDE